MNVWIVLRAKQFPSGSSNLLRRMACQWMWKRPSRFRSGRQSSARASSNETTLYASADALLTNFPEIQLLLMRNCAFRDNPIRIIPESSQEKELLLLLESATGAPSELLRLATTEASDIAIVDS